MANDEQSNRLSAIEASFQASAARMDRLEAFLNKSVQASAARMDRADERMDRADERMDRADEQMERLRTVLVSAGEYLQNAAALAQQNAIALDSLTAASERHDRILDYLLSQRAEEG